MIVRSIMVCAALLAGGCAARYGTFADTLEREAKAINDVNAAIFEEAPCAMALGAWARLENLPRRDALFAGCVPDHERYGIRVITGS